ncbi:MAG: hypothetical protein ACFBSG_14130 [Leptolyngbyaceae cyanobacterium]
MDAAADRGTPAISPPRHLSSTYHELLRVEAVLKKLEASSELPYVVRRLSDRN